MKKLPFIFLIFFACFSVHAQEKRKKTPMQIEPEIVLSDTDDLNQKVEKISERISQLYERIVSIETSQKNEPNEKQKRLLLNLEILSRAEERAENLRQKIFELIEKENELKLRLDQFDFELSEEMINRSVAIAGGLRPEVLREQRRQTLQMQKNNIMNLINQIQSHRMKLEENLTKADTLVEKLRTKLDKEIEETIREN